MASRFLIISFSFDPGADRNDRSAPSVRMVHSQGKSGVWISDRPAGQKSGPPSGGTLIAARTGQVVDGTTGSWRPMTAPPPGRLRGEDLAAVSLRHIGHDGEAEARTRFRPSRGGPEEAVEDVGQVGWVDPRTSVRDLDAAALRPRPRSGRRHHGRTSPRSRSGSRPPVRSAAAARRRPSRRRSPRPGAGCGAPCGRPPTAPAGRAPRSGSARRSDARWPAPPVR